MENQIHEELSIRDLRKMTNELLFKLTQTSTQ